MAWKHLSHLRKGYVAKDWGLPPTALWVLHLGSRSPAPVNPSDDNHCSWSPINNKWLLFLNLRKNPWEKKERKGENEEAIHKYDKKHKERYSTSVLSTKCKKDRK